MKLISLTCDTVLRHIRDEIMNESSTQAYGCATALFLAAVLLAVLTEPPLNWEHHVLPREIEVNTVLASDSASGLRDACEAAVYRLSPATADAIKRHGLAYFARVSSPAVQHNSNPYGTWRATPGEVDIAQNGHGAGSNTIYGLYVMGGCRNSGGPAFLTSVLVDTWSKPGSYFTVSRNREGVIMVDPNKRLAAYYYFG